MTGRRTILLVSKRGAVRGMTDDNGKQDWSVVPLARVADRARALSEIDAIFFQSSATQSFASEGVRATFHERWLGRYVRDEPDLAFVAYTAVAAVVGYIVGSAEDPAASGRYADIPFTRAFAHLSCDYPAHLHVNCSADWRSRGIGAALVTTFSTAVKARGARGLHLVTGAASRNRLFYARQGFEPLGYWGEPGKQAVFLAKPL